VFIITYTNSFITDITLHSTTETYGFGKKTSKNYNNNKKQALKKHIIEYPVTNFLNVG